MKKLLAGILLLIAFSQTHAQYKKASFFARSGRFYEVGSNYRLLGSGRSGGTGFFISAGNAEPGKHIHHSFEFEYLTPVKFNYNTATANGNIAVSGKTGSDFSIRYTLGYFLVKTDDDDKKLLPFINLHFGYLFGSGVEYTSTPSNVYLESDPASTGTGALMYGAGAGVLYKLTNVIGIRASATYSGIYVSDYDKSEAFNAFPNHTSINLAVRFMLHGNDK